jgi:prepilin-type N-terminal cleavage/methylation domain-containing protein
MKRAFEKNGFTLIELLIVIAIIGILAAIATVSYKKVREHAKKKSCNENMFTLEGACVQYSLHHDMGELESLNDGVYEQMMKDGILRDKPKCSSGGEYSIIKLEGGRYAVKCSKHGTRYDQNTPGESPPPTP